MPKLNNDSKTHSHIALAFVLALLAVACALRIAMRSGLEGLDDVFYIRYAHEIAGGTYEPQLHHFAMRFGLLVPLAAVFRVAGVSDLTVTIFPILLSCTVLAATLLVLWRRFSSSAAVAGGLLLGLLPFDVIFASSLRADLAAGYVALSGLIFWSALQYRNTPGEHYGRFSLNVRARPLYLSGFLLGVAFLTKETAIFAAPAFLIAGFFWKSFARLKPGSRLWYWVAGLATPVMLAEAYTWIVTGQFAYRIAAVRAGHNESQIVDFVTNYEGTGLLRRFTVAAPGLLLAGNLFSVLFVLAVPSVVLALLWKWKKVRFFLLWAAFVYLGQVYGTTSLTEFKPLPLSARFLSLLIVPTVILVAASIARAGGAILGVRKTTGLTAMLALLALALVTVALAFFGGQSQFVMSLCVLVALCVSLLPPLTRWSGRLILFSCSFFILISSANALNGIYDRHSSSEEDRIVEQLGDPPALTLTDEITRNVLRVRYGFRHDDRILSFRDRLPKDCDSCLVYLNYRRLEYLKSAYRRPLPGFARRPPEEWELLATLRGLDDRPCRLYRTGSE